MLQSCSPPHVEQALGFKWHRHLNSIPFCVHFINILVSLQILGVVMEMLYIYSLRLAYICPSLPPFTCLPPLTLVSLFPQAFRLACACMLVHTDTSLNSYSTYEIKCTILSRLSLLPCHPPLFRLLPPPPHSLHSTFLPYIFKSRIYKSTNLERKPGVGLSGK